MSGGVNNRDRSIDSSRREDSRQGQIERVEIIAVHPHVSPFNGGAGDRFFNSVDVQLINRPRNEDGTAQVVSFIRINVLQHYHGLFQGNLYTPRVGDMVLLYWITNREGVILGSLVSAQQEPVCRSQANCDHQEIVCKRAPWEAPKQDPNTQNFVEFPFPKHPDCFKAWPLYDGATVYGYDYINVHDCPYGHNRAQCDAQAPCNSLDDIQNGTWWKVFNAHSPTTIDKPRRVKFHHHCGSIWYFDEDGVWRIEGKKAESPLGHIHHYTNGKIEIESPVEVLIKAPKITLDATLVEETNDNKIDGDNSIGGHCSHGSCACDGTSGTSTGTGAEQQIAHGLTDSEGAACTPSIVSACCTGGSGGGSCTCTGCDDTYIWIVAPNGKAYKWVCRP